MKCIFLSLILLFASAIAVAQPVALTPATAEQEICVWDTAVFALNASGPEGDYYFALEGSANWGTIVPKTAHITDFEQVFAYLTPGCFEKTGIYTFNAISAGKTGRAVSILTLHVVPCISLYAKNADAQADQTDITNAQATSQKVCLGDKKTQKIVLKNKSKTTASTYAIALTGDIEGITVAKEAKVAPAGETEIEISFDSVKAGRGKHSFSLGFTALHPETGKPTEDKASANFEYAVETCVSAQLSLDQAGQKCTDEESRFPLSIKNTGRDAMFTAKVENMSFTRLSEEKFFLKNGETKQLELIVNLGIKPRVYVPKIIVSSEFDSFQITPELDYKKCWDVSLSGLGGEVCQCEDKSFILNVINTGAFADSYTVFLKQAPEWFKPEFFNETAVSLKTGQKKTLASAMFDCEAIPSTYTVMFAVLAQSRKSSDDLGIEISVRPKSVCYIAGFDAESTSINVGEAKRLAIRVKNTGIIDNVYVLSLNSPAWASLSQDVLQLKRGEEQDVFITANPTVESAGKEFDFRIKAISKDVVSFKDFKVRVLAEGETVEEEARETLSADVSYDAGVFAVTTEEGALVSFISPAGSSFGVPTQDGVAKIKVNETGEWTIRISKEGKETLETKFNAESISALSGLFSASTRGTVIALVLVVAMGVIAFVYYMAGNKKEGMETKQKNEKKK